ncbi:SDR family NAD(P)-dependent oxidoreductase [Arthrobacter sp. M4]|uniref:SDR family NAD(P)-dependent oxidoreductase n=1 Tax=Arthrobacter sp. M4 TaxID=218160 RepID=UPI001CDD2889|nr:SDR family NAD(P)-dependent oxidoreductase [Arthrobacter sp. M4]MCA4132535.1 SDR family oxidoreductase [Arthrobacter sp. M4]
MTEESTLHTDVLARMRLDRRSALVTGAGQGIGRGFALALAQAGASVTVVDLDNSRAESVAHEIVAAGGKAIAVKADVTDEDAVQNAIDLTIAEFGELTIAVNNAGINRNAAAEDTTLDDWDLHQRINTRAVFRSCQLEAASMLQRGYGKIINTASMSTLLVPHPQKQIAYNVSKAGVVALTRTLAAEWADRGVRVNCISPGIVRTALIEESDELRPLVSRWLQDIPLGRLAEVSDIQAAVVYLAGGTSDYMTGHNLVIEGGQSLW